MTSVCQIMYKLCNTSFKSFFASLFSSFNTLSVIAFLPCGSYQPSYLAKTLQWLLTSGNHVPQNLHRILPSFRIFLYNLSPAWKHTYFQVIFNDFWISRTVKKSVHLSCLSQQQNISCGTLCILHNIQLTVTPYKSLQNDLIIVIVSIMSCFPLFSILIYFITLY